MAELDPLVAEVLLKGDDEFLSKIKQVGNEAVETFNKLAAAADAGASSFTQAAIAFGLVEAALAGITAATIKFVEAQTELSQKTILIAEAFGTTAGQVQQLEATFAGAGVSVEQFERLANRLTITIAREWPAITESIKTYANENDASQLRVSNAILRVRDAQNALADNSESRSAQISKDNDAVAQAYIRLQFAAQHAASEQLGALQAVHGSQLSVTAAEQHLAELEGRPPSAAEKQNLAISQAQQAVDTARRAEADARIAQQEKAAEAELKRTQLEQAYDDARRKAAKDARDDAEQREKDENRVRDAIIQRGEAEEKAAKFALTNIASVRTALDGVAQGNKDVAKTIDLTQVSVQNLTKGIIAQAAETTKATSGVPSGYEVLVQLSKTLSNATEDQISKETRLAIVNRVTATSMQALGSVGAEVLHVLEHNSAELERFSQKAAALDTKEAQDKIRDFRAALASLNLTISLLSQQFAIAVSPTFTAFLKSIEDSIEKSGGLIHEFIEGLKLLGTTLYSTGEFIATVLDKLAQLGGLLPKAFGVSGLDVFKAALIGIGAAITFALGPLAIIPVTIGLIITAVGALRDNWATLTDVVVKFWLSIQDNAVIKFLTGVLSIILKIAQGLAIIDKATAGASSPSSGAQSAPAQATEGHAEGGMIRGPGTGTSDSIISRLSNGEFVVRAQAVSAYGADLFHALNNMMLPGFAAGGLVPSPVRMAGTTNMQPTSVLNLSIDGRSFNGLKGPKSTIDDLSSFAISRQTSAAGSNPSWMK